MKTYQLSFFAYLDVPVFFILSVQTSVSFCICIDWPHHLLPYQHMLAVILLHSNAWHRLPSYYRHFRYSLLFKPVALGIGWQPSQSSCVMCLSWSNRQFTATEQHTSMPVAYMYIHPVQSWVEHALYCPPVSCVSGDQTDSSQPLNNICRCQLHTCTIHPYICRCIWCRQTTGVMATNCNLRQTMVSYSDNVVDSKEQPRRLLSKNNYTNSSSDRELTDWTMWMYRICKLQQTSQTRTLKIADRKWRHVCVYELWFRQKNRMDIIDAWSRSLAITSCGLITDDGMKVWNLVSWLSGKSLKLLPPDVRF